MIKIVAPRNVIESKVINSPRIGGGHINNGSFSSLPADTEEGPLFHPTSPRLGGSARRDKSLSALSDTLRAGAGQDHDQDLELFESLLSENSGEDATDEDDDDFPDLDEAVIGNGTIFMTEVKKKSNNDLKSIRNSVDKTNEDSTTINMDKINSNSQSSGQKIFEEPVNDKPSEGELASLKVNDSVICVSSEIYQSDKTLDKIGVTDIAKLCLLEVNREEVLEITSAIGEINETNGILINGSSNVNNFTVETGTTDTIPIIISEPAGNDVKSNNFDMISEKIEENITASHKGDQIENVIDKAILKDDIEIENTNDKINEYSPFVKTVVFNETINSLKQRSNTDLVITNIAEQVITEMSVSETMNDCLEDNKIYENSSSPNSTETVKKLTENNTIHTSVDSNETETEKTVLDEDLTTPLSPQKKEFIENIMSNKENDKLLEDNNKEIIPDLRPTNNPQSDDLHEIDNLDLNLSNNVNIAETVINTDADKITTESFIASHSTEKKPENKSITEIGIEEKPHKNELKVETENIITIKLPKDLLTGNKKEKSQELVRKDDLITTSLNMKDKDIRVASDVDSGSNKQADENIANKKKVSCISTNELMNMKENTNNFAKNSISSESSEENSSFISSHKNSSENSSGTLKAIKNLFGFGKTKKDTEPSSPKESKKIKKIITKTLLIGSKETDIDEDLNIPENTPMSKSSENKKTQKSEPQNSSDINVQEERNNDKNEIGESESTNQQDSECHNNCYQKEKNNLDDKTNEINLNNTGISVSSTNMEGTDLMVKKDESLNVPVIDMSEVEQKTDVNKDSCSRSDAKPNSEDDKLADTNIKSSDSESCSKSAVGSTTCGMAKTDSYIVDECVKSPDFNSQENSGAQDVSLLDKNDSDIDSVINRNISELEETGKTRNTDVTSDVAMDLSTSQQTEVYRKIELDQVSERFSKCSDQQDSSSYGNKNLDNLSEKTEIEITSEVIKKEDCKLNPSLTEITSSNISSANNASNETVLSINYPVETISSEVVDTAKQGGNNIGNCSVVSSEDVEMDHCSASLINVEQREKVNTVSISEQKEANGYFLDKCEVNVVNINNDETIPIPNAKDTDDYAPEVINDLEKESNNSLFKDVNSEFSENRSDENIDTAHDTRNDIDNISSTLEVNGYNTNCNLSALTEENNVSLIEDNSIRKNGSISEVTLKNISDMEIAPEDLNNSDDTFNNHTETFYDAVSDVCIYDNLKMDEVIENNASIENQAEHVEQKDALPSTMEQTEIEIFFEEIEIEGIPEKELTVVEHQIENTEPDFAKKTETDTKSSPEKEIGIENNLIEDKEILDSIEEGSNITDKTRTEYEQTKESIENKEIIELSKESSNNSDFSLEASNNDSNESRNESNQSRNDTNDSNDSNGSRSDNNESRNDCNESRIDSNESRNDSNESKNDNNSIEINSDLTQPTESEESKLSLISSDTKNNEEHINPESKDKLSEIVPSGTESNGDDVDQIANESHGNVSEIIPKEDKSLEPPFIAINDHITAQEKLSDENTENVARSKSGDLFSQISGTKRSIERSKSRTELGIVMEQPELAKSPSRTKLADKKPETGPGYPQRESSSKPKDQEAKLKSQEPELEYPLVQSPVQRRKMEELERMQYTRKLDSVFALIRSESVEDIKTDIKIRGMGNIQLKNKAPKKSVVERNKMDEDKVDRKGVQKGFSLPDKPAKFPRLKPKPKPKDPSPPPKEPTPPPPKEQTPPPPPPPSTPPPKEPTPPPPKELTPPPKPVVVAPLPPTPTIPRVYSVILPKIGINGFDRMGRLVLRSAMETGYDIIAVNEPYIPVHYIVEALLFDLKHSSVNVNRGKQGPNVAISPMGHIVINGKTITVFTEKDATKIPWASLGVDCVIEATEGLRSGALARRHLKTSQKNQENEDEEEDRELVESSVKRVILAGSSIDSPTFAIGVNDCNITGDLEVMGHASPTVSAIAIVLKILEDKFHIEQCSYTLLKAVIGPSKEVKCPNLGPNNHTRSLRWDFKETLVPVTCTDLEGEIISLIPSLKGHITGVMVYTPVPEVSMFDLTVTLQKESDDIYREVCYAMKSAAEGPLRRVLKYIMKTGNENSASCVYLGCPQSVVFDARSGCQVTSKTVKLILWFDNETGFCNRVVDLVRKAYQAASVNQ